MIQRSFARYSLRRKLLYSRIQLLNGEVVRTSFNLINSIYSTRRPESDTFSIIDNRYDVAGHHLTSKLHMSTLLLLMQYLMGSSVLVSAPAFSSRVMHDSWFHRDARNRGVRNLPATTGFIRCQESTQLRFIHASWNL